MLFVEGSVSGDGATVTFSIDNGKSYDTPAKLFVVDAAKRKFPARPSDYTPYPLDRSIPRWRPAQKVW